MTFFQAEITFEEERCQELNGDLRALQRELEGRRREYGAAEHSTPSKDTLERKLRTMENRLEKVRVSRGVHVTPNVIVTAVLHIIFFHLRSPRSLCLFIKPNT